MLDDLALKRRRFDTGFEANYHRICCDHVKESVKTRMVSYMTVFIPHEKAGTDAVFRQQMNL